MSLEIFTQKSLYGLYWCGVLLCSEVPDSSTWEGKGIGVSAPNGDYNTGEVLICVLETVISRGNPYILPF